LSEAADVEHSEGEASVAERGLVELVLIHAALRTRTRAQSFMSRC